MEITGWVTKDAEVKTLANERQVVSFSIAVNDYVKRKGAAEGEQLTQYFNCGYWLNTGVAAKLLKSTLVTLTGRLETKPYMSKEGEARAAANFHCDRIKVHGLTAKNATSPEAQPQEERQLVEGIENIAAITEPAEDLPF